MGQPKTTIPGTTCEVTGVEMDGPARAPDRPYRAAIEARESRGCTEVRLDRYEFQGRLSVKAVSNVRHEKEYLLEFLGEPDTVIFQAGAFNLVHCA